MKFYDKEKQQFRSQLKRALTVGSISIELLMLIKPLGANPIVYKSSNEIHESSSVLSISHLTQNASKCLLIVCTKVVLKNPFRCLFNVLSHPHDDLLQASLIPNLLFLRSPFSCRQQKPYLEYEN